MMADARGRSRLNPTLFDKLVAGSEIAALRGGEVEEADESRATLRYYSVEKLERFNETALRATVRRELAWLLNTTNLAARVDLERYPQVATSVLNYGVPDLAGRSFGRRVVLQRAREIRAAILAFEPRMDESTLVVEPAPQVERENSVTYVIHGDVRSAVRALPVEFRTDIEADSAAATVRT